jgi:hypothetical protein
VPPRGDRPDRDRAQQHRDVVPADRLARGQGDAQVVAGKGKGGGGVAVVQVAVDQVDQLTVDGWQLTVAVAVDGWQWQWLGGSGGGR